MITVEEIDKLAEEFKLDKWTFTYSISLLIKLPGYNNPEVFNFRRDNLDQYYLHTYLTGINDNNELVYTMIFADGSDCYEYCRQKFKDFNLTYKQYKQKCKLATLQEDFK